MLVNLVYFIKTSGNLVFNLKGFNTWALQDDVGVLTTGTEEEIRAKFADPDQFFMYEKIVGSLKLVEIHGEIK